MICRLKAFVFLRSRGANRCGECPPDKRTTMTLASLALLGILISSSFALAQSLKEIRVGSSNISVTNLAAFYARDRKFFEAEGFDVKMIIVKTEAALPALVAGDLDYSTLSTSAIEAALNGLPLRVIAVTNKHPLLGLAVRKGINNVADLRGGKRTRSLTYSEAATGIFSSGKSGRGADPNVRGDHRGRSRSPSFRLQFSSRSSERTQAIGQWKGIQSVSKKRGVTSMSPTRPDVL